MRSTEETVRALYAAFIAGDKDGMLAEMADDVELRFLGARVLHGRQEASDFIDTQAGSLTDVDFQLTELVVDGDHAAGVWRETATRADGTPWRNHGVDVFRVQAGRVVSLHENNDVREFYGLIPDEYRAAAAPSREAGPPTDGSRG